MLYGVPWGGLFYLLVLELVAVIAGIAAVSGSNDPLTVTVGWALVVGGAVLVLGASVASSRSTRTTDPEPTPGHHEHDALLHRLERLGHVRSGWETSPEGRRRRSYAITDAGRDQLAHQRRQWETATRTLGGIWGLSAPAFGGGA